MHTKVARSGRLYSLNHLMCVEDLVSLSARDGGATRQPSAILRILRHSTPFYAILRHPRFV